MYKHLGYIVVQQYTGILKDQYGAAIVFDSKKEAEESSKFKSFLIDQLIPITHRHRSMIPKKIK